jgi:hypothetical protein
VFGKVNSPFYFLRSGQESKARSCLREFLNGEIVDRLLSSFKTIIHYEKELDLENTKHKKNVFQKAWVLVKEYNSEICYGCYLAVAVAFTGFSVFLAYSSTMLANPDSPSDKHLMTIILPLYPIVELMCIMVATYFDIHSTRKRTHLIGVFLYTFLWSGLAASFWYDCWVIAKVIGFFFFISKGVFLVPSFFIIATDCFNSEIFGICCAIHNLACFVSTIVPPYVINDPARLPGFCLVISGMCMVIGVVSWFYVFETDGMEKHEIYARFRKLTLPTRMLDVKIRNASRPLEHGDLLDDSRLNSALMRTSRSIELGNFNSINGLHAMLLDKRVTIESGF